MWRLKFQMVLNYCLVVVCEYFWSSAADFRGSRIHKSGYSMSQSLSPESSKKTTTIFQRFLSSLSDSWLNDANSKFSICFCVFSSIFSFFCSGLFFISNRELWRSTVKWSELRDTAYTWIIFIHMRLVLTQSQSVSFHSHVVSDVLDFVPLLTGFACKNLINYVLFTAILSFVSLLRTETSFPRDYSFRIISILIWLHVLFNDELVCRQHDFVQLYLNDDQHGVLSKYIIKENKEWHVGFLGGVYLLVKQVTISHVVKNRCKCTIQRYVGDCLSLYLVVTWEHFTRS